ncbi:MAG: hypothetical protein AAF739_04860 [Pseudomonadota bacterium]
MNFLRALLKRWEPSPEERLEMMTEHLCDRLRADVGLPPRQKEYTLDNHTPNCINR